MLETWRAGLRTISASTWSKPAGTSGPLDSPRTYRQAEVEGAAPCPEKHPGLQAQEPEAVRTGWSWRGPRACPPQTAGLLQPETKTLVEKAGRQPASELARGPPATWCWCFCAGPSRGEWDALERPGPPWDPHSGAAGLHIMRMLVQPVGRPVGEDMRLLEAAPPAPVKPSDEDTPATPQVQPHDRA